MNPISPQLKRSRVKLDCAPELLLSANEPGPLPELVDKESLIEGHGETLFQEDFTTTTPQCSQNLGIDRDQGVATEA